MSAVSPFGVDKLFGNGLSQSGEFMIPPNKTNNLRQYQHLLTKKQKEDIMIPLQSGGILIIKPKKQQNGGLGTLLASIGIPLVSKALTGSDDFGHGLQNRPPSYNSSKKGPGGFGSGLQNRPSSDQKKDLIQVNFEECLKAKAGTEYH